MLAGKSMLGGGKAMLSSLLTTKSSSSRAVAAGPGATKDDLTRALFITIYRATDLHNKRMAVVGGTINPYCQIGDFDGPVVGGQNSGKGAAQQTAKTRACKDDLNPVWNEEVNLEIMTGRMAGYDANSFSLAYQQQSYWY